jgi:hypothetical protein
LRIAGGQRVAGRYRTIDEAAPLREVAAQRAGTWVPDTAWNKFVEVTIAEQGKTGEIF